jgi:tetratricopeptide (TPR) repeat protein
MEMYSEKVIEFFKKIGVQEFKYQYNPCKHDNEISRSGLGNFFALINALDQLLKQWHDISRNDKDSEDELDLRKILIAPVISIEKNASTNSFVVSIDLSDFEEIVDFDHFIYKLPSVKDIFEDNYLFDKINELLAFQQVTSPEDPDERDDFIQEYFELVMQFNLFCYSMLAYNSIFNFELEVLLPTIDLIAETKLIDKNTIPSFLSYFLGMAYFFKGDGGVGVEYLKHFISDMDLNQRKEWLFLSFILLFNCNEGAALKKIDIYLIDKKIPDSYKYMLLRAFSVIMDEEGDQKQVRRYSQKADKLCFRDFESALFQLDQYYVEDEDELAQQLLEKLERLKPEDYDLLCLKADFLLAAEEYKEAFSVCSKIDNLKPETTTNYYRKAMCYKELDDIKNARIYFDKAMQSELRIPEFNIEEFRLELEELEKQSIKEPNEQFTIDLDNL